MTFSSVFSKHSFFSRLKVIETLKNTGTKFFSWWVANVRVRLNEIRPKQKTFTHKGTCCGLKKEKKNQDFLPFFRTLPLFSRLFPGLENCSANFKTFLRIQDSVRTLLLSRGLEKATDIGIRADISLCISVTLPTYPSLKPTFCPQWEVGVNVRLGDR